MRELKFRVWQDDKMSYLDQVFVGIGQIGFSDTHYVDLNAHDKEDVVLMQYTGLKDKNGKEIYEGDIVRSGSLKHGYSFAVAYGDIIDFNSMTDKDVIGVGFNLSSDGINTYEIIGNIYESPGLLK